MEDAFEFVEKFSKKILSVIWCEGIIKSIITDPKKIDFNKISKSKKNKNAFKNSFLPNKKKLNIKIISVFNEYAKFGGLKNIIVNTK